MNSRKYTVYLRARFTDFQQRPDVFLDFDTYICYDRRNLNARIGIPEYWRFDPSGGRYHGEPLYGGILTGGEYRPVELTTGPDGTLKGYSPLLGFSLAWDEGWPRFFDPETGAYLENWRQTAARAEAESEVRRLREQLRRQPG